VRDKPARETGPNSSRNTCLEKIGKKLNALPLTYRSSIVNAEPEKTASLSQLYFQEV
jgi:hypothetical protein